jgi:hypothetical protein
MQKKSLWLVLLASFLFASCAPGKQSRPSLAAPTLITPTMISTGETSLPASTGDFASFSYYSNIQYEDVNQSIRLTVFPPTQMDSLRQTQDFKLQIENTSETQIDFPLDWGEKIYQYWESDASWHLIENRVTYAGKAITLLGRSNENGISSFLLNAFPTLTQGKGWQIRIIVSGITVPDNKPVLAYIDLELQP